MLAFALPAVCRHSSRCCVRIFKPGLTRFLAVVKVPLVLGFDSCQLLLFLDSVDESYIGLTMRATMHSSPDRLTTLPSGSAYANASPASMRACRTFGLAASTFSPLKGPYIMVPL